MNVTQNNRGELTIEGLSAGQFAYIVGVVGMSAARADWTGKLGGDPVVADAEELYLRLSQAAAKGGLDTLATAVEGSQEAWRRRTARAERKTVAA